MRRTAASRAVIILAAALAAAGAPGAARAAAGEPLSVDRVEAYTLEIGPDGPGRWYFPLGLRPGLTHLTTHAGFNLLQVQSTHTGFRDRGEPFPEAPAPTRFGHLYFSLGRGGETLGRGRGLPRQTATHGLLPAALDPGGQPWRGRAGVNIYDRSTTDYLRLYAKRKVARWGSDHPPGQATIFWGMDNEWEMTGFDYSAPGPGSEQFGAWLRAAYGDDIGGLNEAWGTALPDFAAVAGVPMPAQAIGKRGADSPDFRQRPGLFLDWMNFRSETFTRLKADIARTMHENDPHRRPVVDKNTHQTIEMPRVNRHYTFDHALFAELVRPFSGGLLGANAYGSGDRQAYEVNYLQQCLIPESGDGRWGVMLPETNNHRGPGHQWAATFWRLLANGLKAVNFFCTGYPGATGDYDTFGHVEAATGRPLDKMFYAARWAHTVHRTERLWSEAMPAPGLPRVALLLPRRDVLLSERTAESSSPWAQARNRRVIVFRRLREQGYWVDIIPYRKLEIDFLAGYQALFLVGAEHLAAAECRAVTDYVRAGGVLVADARAGFFDEHHRARRRLDEVLGLTLGALDPEAETTVEFEEVPLKVRGRVAVEPAGARTVAAGADGNPLVLAGRYGRGRVLYFATELGAMDTATPELLPGFLAEDVEETAEAEEYGAYATEDMPGRWLGRMLTAVGLSPAVRLAAGAENYGPLLRVEQPLADRRGNLALVVTTRAQREQETVPPLALELPLPGGPWRRGLWAPAEHMGLAEVTLTPRRGGRHRVHLPGLESAGVLYLLRDHPPLLSIEPPETAAGTAVDGHAPRVRPGEAFTLRVRLHNPAAAPLAGGQLRLIAAEGWTVSPPVQPTAPWRPGLFRRRPETAEFRFTVTADPVDENIQPDWLYPLVIRWSEDGRDRAVCSLNVEAMPDPSRVRRLLSDNLFSTRGDWPDTYPWRLPTGAVYRHLAPDADRFADPDGNALTAGARTTVRYRADRAEIVFDLGAPYRVDRVQVRGESGETVLATSTSADGENWGPPAAFSQVNDLWQEAGAARADFPPAVARYVRLEARFSGGSGELGEVEIWGRPAE